MLGRLLHPLDARQQTLLLTALSFGGSQANELFSMLPEEEAQALRQKASKLEEIPREKRVPLMVRQLKQLFSFGAMHPLDGVDPSWILAALKGESPRVVSMILMHLPSSLARKLTGRLPPKIQKRLPDRGEYAGVPIEIKKLVRARFNDKFARMPRVDKMEEFGFPDLVLLTAHELVACLPRLGADEIANSFLSMGKRALADFLRKVPPTTAEEILTAAKSLDKSTLVEVKTAQVFLGRVLDNYKNPEEFMQKAGLYRLARALEHDDDVVVQRFCQRFPRAHGRVLNSYIERIRRRGGSPEEHVLAVRDAILNEVVDLAKRGKIDNRYGQYQVILEAG